MNLAPPLNAARAPSPTNNNRQDGSGNLWLDLSQALEAGGVATSNTAQGQTQRIVNVTVLLRGVPESARMKALITLTERDRVEFALFQRGDQVYLVRGMANGIAYNRQTMRGMEQLFHIHPQYGIQYAEPSGYDVQATGADPSHAGKVVTLDGWVCPYSASDPFGAPTWGQRYNLFTGARGPGQYGR